MKKTEEIVTLTNFFSDYLHLSEIINKTLRSIIVKTIIFNQIDEFGII